LLRKKLRLIVGLAGKHPGLRPLLLALVVFLITGLIDIGDQVLRQPAPDPRPSEMFAATTLSLQLQRRGADLIVSWNRNAATILHATAGTLRIRDGTAAQQELRLDAEQLRNPSLVYTPVNNNVQVWMTVSGAAGQTLNESVLAVTAPIKATLPVRQNSLSTSSARPNAVWYAVQVGTFRNRANAERLRNEMEGRYGPSRLVSQPSNLALWRVIVGRETSLEGASKLMARIRNGSRANTRQVLLIREQEP